MGILHREPLTNNAIFLSAILPFVPCALQFLLVSSPRTCLLAQNATSGHERRRTCGLIFPCAPYTTVDAMTHVYDAVETARDDLTGKHLSVPKMERAEINQISNFTLSNDSKGSGVVNNAHPHTVPGGADTNSSQLPLRRIDSALALYENQSSSSIL